MSRNFTLLITFALLGFVSAKPTENKLNPDPSPGFDCSDKKDDTYWPHPTDCAGFYHCNGGLAWFSRCADGLHFNPSKNVCDWPENVNCPSESKARNPVPSPDFDCSDKKDDTYWPHPTDCAGFYHCNDGLAWFSRCADGLHFNPAKNVCDWPENVSCPVKKFEVKDPVPSPDFDCSDKEDDTYWPHPTDCAGFYHCNAGLAWFSRCADGLLFNPVKKVCDWPEEVTCPAVKSINKIFRH